MVNKSAAKKSALIFGLNNYALEIEANVKNRYDDVRIYALEEEEIAAFKVNAELFDVSDEWESVAASIDVKNSIAFCVLEESAQNIFLTISLRAHFSELMIVAIASNKESANKLKMAGANSVIPLVETTAEIIANVLEKPISNKVLHKILYEESALKIEQVQIQNAAFFKEKRVGDTHWSRYRGIVILSVIHEDMSHEYIYAKKLQNYTLQNGDILVVAGFERDIEDFKKLIGSRES